MYKQLTAEDFRKFHGLGNDYRVDGMFIVGNYKVEEETERLKRVLNVKFGDYEIKKLEHQFLNSGCEIKVNGKTIWFFVVYGGTLLSEFLHIGCVLGSKKNILSGVCGGLLPGGKVGEIILPTESTSDGSTVFMYDRTKRLHQKSSTGLRKQIKKYLENQKLVVHEGPTVTCQAMLGETAEDIQLWSHKGYMGVEMEASTVFAVSKHFGAESAAILSIADNLIEEQTVLHENYENTKQLRQSVRDAQFMAALQHLT